MGGGMRAGPSPAEITSCRSCGADIVFLKTRAGKRMPVNVTPTKPEFRGPNHGEIEYVHGEHEPHWGTCDDAERFR